MPSTDQETHDLIVKWFGSIADYPVIQYLEAHGYVLDRQWFWTKPTPSHQMSEYEIVCIWFLISEWDFGGLKPKQASS